MEPRTEKETRLIEQLRVALKDLNLSKDYLQDKNLVRWLRARNHNLKDAEQMIRKNIDWMRELNIENILDTSQNYFPHDFYQDFNFRTTGFDKQGSPVFLLNVGKWDIKRAMDDGLKSEFLRYVLFITERAFAVCRSESKRNGLDYIPQFVGIYDFTGLGFRQATCTDVMDVTLKFARMFEANYPETLKCGFILNAPWAFQVLWKLVRPFLTERTHSKFIFLDSDPANWRESISKVVPMDQFPESYGGIADDAAEIKVEKDGSWSRSWNENIHDEVFEK